MKSAKLFALILGLTIACKGRDKSEARQQVASPAVSVENEKNAEAGGAGEAMALD